MRPPRTSARTCRHCRHTAAVLLGTLWLLAAAGVGADFPVSPDAIRERQLLVQVTEELELLLQSVRRVQRDAGVGSIEKFHYPALLQDLRHIRDGVLNYLEEPSRIPRRMEPLRRLYSAPGAE